MSDTPDPITIQECPELTLTAAGYGEDLATALAASLVHVHTGYVPMMSVEIVPEDDGSHSSRWSAAVQTDEDGSAHVVHGSPGLPAQDVMIRLALEVDALEDGTGTPSHPRGATVPLPSWWDGPDPRGEGS